MGHTERDHRFPGSQAREWLTTMLSVPRNEFAEFPAARSFAMLLGYQRAVVAAELGWLDAVIADLRGGTLTWSREQLAEVARSSFSD
ncbi:MAG TPA: hypothetical protein VGI72_03320 [Gaiellales bacterium]